MLIDFLFVRISNNSLHLTSLRRLWMQQGTIDYGWNYQLLIESTQLKLALLQILFLVLTGCGFFIVYYMFFIEWAIFNEITKQGNKGKDKFRLQKDNQEYVLAFQFQLKKLFEVFIVNLAVNSIATSIGLLKWDKVYRAMNDICLGFFEIIKFGQGKRKE